MKPNMVFFSCRMPEKLTRKTGLEVMTTMPRFKPRKETHLQAKAYLYVSHLEAYISCTPAAFTTLNICSRGPNEQTNKYTNIQTHFWKGNQAHAHV